ncbi:hypothetical protein [Pseudomonas psychrophila]|uniref:hypothetical protein n=1 Tax=Pseudomonas psychrophila TaxID=122355 RepID=UPI00036E90FB|nr:hypothetical protein [Pseudomonas psychrophila]
MKVKSIRWTSIAAQEAEVEITDDDYICTVFSQPCEVSVGDNLNEPLHIFDIKNVRINEELTPSIASNCNDTLKRKIVGKVIDTENQIILVGKLRFIVDDYLPGGLQAGDYIEFDCERIDLW